ncbi:hypothetical protein KOR42_06170 [Thalassoglobus neptunius]|uniref:Uncharacterized protein n=1 Tax=Thalassoglobus neptunius TaxID=1938619 RepID=A0A5C5X3V2_9PLAN|nr:hypothetical protein [Thalassoglobus neptunius]TWT57259.1 hypothetical protein KOR42_06170 [Thalassoglobus neptunius]
MGCTITRTYSPALITATKLQKSDGDLVWEAGRNTPPWAMFLDGSNVVQVYGARAGFWTQPSGLITDSSYFSNSSGTLGDTVSADIGSTHVVMATPRLGGGFGNFGQITAIDLSDGSIDLDLGESFSSSVWYNAISHAPSSDLFDILFPTQIDRYSISGGGTTGTQKFSLTGKSQDKRRRILSDGTHYYLGIFTTRGRVAKTLISDLTTASTLDAGSDFSNDYRMGDRGAIAGGYIAYGEDPGSYVTVVSTSSMSVAYRVAFASNTILSMDTKSGATVVCSEQNSSPGTIDITLIDSGGSEDWTVSYSGTVFDDIWHDPKPYFSSDGSSIYVTGDFTINGVSVQVLKLDASDGSLEWCYTIGSGVSGSGSARATNTPTDLVESGSYLYISCQNNAPNYL